LRLIVDQSPIRVNVVEAEKDKNARKLGAKSQPTFIKIDSTRNFSASHRRQAIAAFRAYNPDTDKTTRSEPLWATKNSSKNIAFNPFSPVKAKVLKKNIGNQGSSKLFFNLKYGGMQVKHQPKEIVERVKIESPPRKNKALEKIDYDSPRTSKGWTNPLRFFYPSSP
jgi:hypothetical protein